MKRIRHKVGDTFFVTGRYKDENGAPVDLTAAGITIASGFRDWQDHLSLGEVVILDQVTSPGQFTVSSSTDNWEPDTETQWDIQFTKDGVEYSTETILLILYPAITAAAA